MRNFREVGKTNDKFKKGLSRLLKIYLSEFESHYSIIQRENGFFLELAAVDSTKLKEEFKERLKELTIFKFDICGEEKPNQIRILSFNHFAIELFQILFFPLGKPDKMDDRIWALLPDEVRFNWNNFSEQLRADIVAHLSCNLAMNYQRLVKEKLGEELGNSNTKQLKAWLLAPMIKMLKFKDKNLIKENLMANPAGGSPLVRPISCASAKWSSSLTIKVFLPNSNEEQLLTEVLKKRTPKNPIDLLSLKMVKSIQVRKIENDKHESGLKDLNRNPQRSASIPVNSHHKNNRNMSSSLAIQDSDDSDEERTASSTSPASIDEHDWHINSDLEEIQDDANSSSKVGLSLRYTTGSKIPDFDEVPHKQTDELELKRQEDSKQYPEDITEDKMLSVSVALPQEQNNEADKTNLINLFKDKHKKRFNQDKRKCCLFYRPQTEIKKINTLEGLVAHAQKENNRSRQVMLDLGWLLKNGDINVDNINLPQEIRSMYKPK